MTTRSITLSNDFHGREVTLRARDNRINLGQIRRARRILCGVAGCCCGGEFGERGYQSVELDPIYDGERIIGAEVRE